MKHDYAGNARALVGTRFRPQGRDPKIGLDCVGLLLATFGIPTVGVRRNYRLRGNHRKEIECALSAHFRRVAPAGRRSGDMMLMEVANDQLHFGICTAAGFVHADARLGRVVETPGEPQWRVLGVYRKLLRSAR
ncbi:MAG: peptidoglycan endopeptidase [Sphingomicrobium sp.]